MGREIKYLPLSNAKPLIRDSDLIVWRGPGFVARRGGGVEYHASKLGWWGDDLFSLDTHWRRGGDIRLLKTDVAAFSGRLDWYRVNPNDLPYDREGALDFMRELVDRPYGWRHLACAGCRHVWPIRLFVSREITDETQENCKFPPFCSEACSGSDRIGGGYDPCPSRADCLTRPCDMAASDFYQYAGTLICDADARNLELQNDPDYMAWLEEHWHCVCHSPMRLITC